MVKRFFCCILVLTIAVVASLILDENDIAVFTSASIKNNYTIIIDAGHGGFDGGCVAADGTLEKDLNLEISLKLDVMLKSLGFNTILIRSTDTAVNTEGSSIRQKKISDIKYRYSVMNANQDSIYLCIHQNRYSSSAVHGTQFFYCPKDSKSKFLAQKLQNSIVNQIQPENTRPIKKCTSDVYLIHNATTPAVLVECGFLSNNNDLNKLKSEKYQKQLCFSLASGLIEYINEL